MLRLLAKLFQRRVTILEQNLHECDESQEWTALCGSRAGTLIVLWGGTSCRIMLLHERILAAAGTSLKMMARGDD